jgi:KTSC domain
MNISKEAVKCHIPTIDTYIKLFGLLLIKKDTGVNSRTTILIVTFSSGKTKAFVGVPEYIFNEMVALNNRRSSIVSYFKTNVENGKKFSTFDVELK